MAPVSEAMERGQGARGAVSGAVSEACGPNQLELFPLPGNSDDDFVRLLAQRHFPECDAIRLVEVTQLGHVLKRFVSMAASSDPRKILARSVSRISILNDV